MGYVEYELSKLRDRLSDYKEELARAIDSKNETEIRHWKRLVEEVENLIEGYENR